MKAAPRILIVDDDPQLGRVIRTGLSAHGFEVRLEDNAEAAWQAFGHWKPDLIVTDLAMPGMDGLALCRKLRLESDVPIIVLSVNREESVKVDLLDAGADDYLTKPFGMPELQARIRTLLRRTLLAGKETRTILADGDFFIDLQARVVKVRDHEIRLTPKEYELLVYFFRNAGKALAQKTLISAVWGAERTQQTEYLRVFVNQLRKKIEPDPLKPRYILTEPWIGYRFNPGI